MSLASNEKIDQSAHCEAKLAEVRAAAERAPGTLTQQSHIPPETIDTGTKKAVHF